MKRVTITLAIGLAVLTLAGSLQAGAHRRVENQRRFNEFRIERSASIAHHRTPLWNIPGHIMIELDKAASKWANNRRANVAHTGIMSPKAIEQTLPLALKRKNLIDANRKALYKGAEYVAQL